MIDRTAAAGQQIAKAAGVASRLPVSGLECNASSALLRRANRGPRFSPELVMLGGR
jgi:hypothetical protein